MQPTLDSSTLQTLFAPVRTANAAFKALYPGESPLRQPVHTVYGGAHLFKRDTAQSLGRAALRALEEAAPDPGSFATCFGFAGAPWAETVYARVKSKLAREAVEDFRLDFEDGYGNRPHAEEDGHAVSAATEVAEGLRAGSLPPFIGLRIKSFSDELCGRAWRTCDLFVSTLWELCGRLLPDGFVVTLPKVTSPEQVTALAGLLERLEQKLGMPAGLLKLEIMVEVTQAILSPTGNVPLLAMVQAGKGRCVGAHFGTYDYTASCNITAAHQHMVHPACDFARHVMQVALSNTGVMLSDGATNVIPVGPHRAAKGGAPLTAAQIRENVETVRRVWALNYEHVRHSLTHAYYQGWDLHPAQLPVRYAAVYAFFLEGLEAASARLCAFLDKAAQATLLGEVFDDAATGQGLLNFFLRGMACGAITEAEALKTGLSLDELRSRSFLKILDNRGHT
jgi:hypothetical protein